ncbi:hypothetical protein [Bartonella massiliensis]|uniref:hypothetical protein n=1 Tax=Bartonella massiliensis TaxID=929795 RepID=UPI00163BF91D|nr:hypothetical protein [Bartonella massiliensis]
MKRRGLVFVVFMKGAWGQVCFMLLSKQNVFEESWCGCINGLMGSEEAGLFDSAFYCKSSVKENDPTIGRRG